jgi:hypothetical protein
MTRYLLRVYRGPAFYPDRSSQSVCRRRLARRARRFERDGFRVTLIALPTRAQARRRRSHPGPMLDHAAAQRGIQAWGRSEG